MAYDPTFFPEFGPEPEEFRSDTPTHPGEMLRRVLAARGMSQAELAARVGLSPKHVNQVLHGIALMSPDAAIALERVLGTPASIWTRLDTRWQEARSRERAHQTLSEYTVWTDHFPLIELKKRDLLSGIEQGPALADALLRLFRVVSPQAFDRVWLGTLQGGFRRAQQFEVDKYATATWLMLAERQAEHISIEPFSTSRLRRALTELRRLTRLPVALGFVEARRLLAECGVKLVFIESIGGCRAHAATWWVTPSQPIVALSERQKRVDSFWYSLFHEIAHLILHPRRQVFVDFAKDFGDDQDGKETQANNFAAEILVPRQHDATIRTLPLNELPNFATSLEVGTEIVAGRRGHLTANWPSVSRFRTALDVVGLREAADQ
jgi:HTH-type transcriptional regulator / antitoxin HigA